MCWRALAFLLRYDDFNGASSPEVEYYCILQLFSYTVESQPDRTYAPDVIVDIPGVLQPDVMVVIGAHYDDRAKNITNSTVGLQSALFLRSAFSHDY